MTFDKKKIATHLSKKLEDNPAIDSDGSLEAKEANRMFSESYGLSIDAEQAWNKVEGRISEEVSRPNWFLRIAASVSILAIASIAYLILTPSKEVYTAEKSITPVDLVDGSNITLNKNSKLVVDPKFGKQNRIVFLEGEAFFEVESNPEKPFIANTNNGVIKVLGTSFNIETTKSTTEVFVKSGIVEVSANGESLEITAGQKVISSSDNIQLVDSDENEISWQTRMLVFDNDPVSEVVSRLSELHGVVINYDDNLANCMVTIKFDNKSLSESLKLLRKIIPIKIQKKNQEYFLSGEGC